MHSSLAVPTFVADCKKLLRTLRRLSGCGANLSSAGVRTEARFVEGRDDAAGRDDRVDPFAVGVGDLDLARPEVVGQLFHRARADDSGERSPVISKGLNISAGGRTEIRLTSEAARDDYAVKKGSVEVSILVKGVFDYG